MSKKRLFRALLVSLILWQLIPGTLLPLFPYLVPAFSSLTGVNTGLYGDIVLRVNGNNSDFMRIVWEIFGLQFVATLIACIGLYVFWNPARYLFPIVMLLNLAFGGKYAYLAGVIVLSGCILGLMLDCSLKGLFHKRVAASEVCGTVSWDRLQRAARASEQSADTAPVETASVPTHISEEQNTAHRGDP